MEDLKSKVNLEDILKITDIEFKKYFKDWLQNDEIANELQARLRRDLVVHFNKTTLGRKIFSKHIYSQRMIFSPLILVLNTLVSEFLYAQNCHYSLSVLCTEIPYCNTLPDFENTKNFRFHENEILEIFDAINGKNISKDIRHEICSEYLANVKGAIPLSLLYVIFKNLFKPKLALNLNSKETSTQEGEIIKAEQEQPNTNKIAINTEENQSNSKKNIGTSEKINKNSDKNLVCENTEKSNCDDSVVENSSMSSIVEKNLDNNETKYSYKKDSTLFNNNFRYLNKYLITLSKKVKNMSANVEKVDKEKLQIKKKTINDRNFNYINRSLEKITDNLRILASSKKKNRRFTMIIKGIEQMTKQFENCAKNFESISFKSKLSTEKSYDDWLKDLQTTKSGQKFISKVETCLRKTLDREREKIIEAYGIKFAKEKEILKLKYKKKIIMLMNTIQQIQEEAEDNKNLYFENETKLKELNNLKTIESFQKFTQTEEANQLINNEMNETSFDEISPSVLRLAKKISEKNKSIPQQCNKTIQQIARKTAEYEQTNNNVLLELLPKKTEQFFDHIVYDAKLRIAELEKETAALDKTFKEHLRKQETFKAEATFNIESIWKNYQRDKNLISMKCTALRDQSPYKVRSNMLSKELNFEKILREIPQINIDNIVEKYAKNKNSIDTINSKPSNFENPFQELKNIFLKTPLQSASANNEFTNSSYNLPSSTNHNLDYKKKIIIPDIRLDECKDNSKESQDKKKSSNKSSLDAQSSNLLAQVDLKNTSLDGIELSSMKSSSTSSPPPAISHLTVFKSKRELFPKETLSAKSDVLKDQRELRKKSKKTKTIKKLSSCSIEHFNDYLAKGDGLQDEVSKSNQNSSHEDQTSHGSKIHSDEPLSLQRMFENNLISPKTEVIENNKIKINIQNLTIPKNDDNQSTGSNESSLSVMNVNFQTKNSAQSSTPIRSPKLDDNIFQLNSFRKDEDVIKILNSSESGTSIKSNRPAGITDPEDIEKSKNGSEDNLEIPSVLHDISSSGNSNLSISMSIGGDVNDDKSIDDFWN